MSRTNKTLTADSNFRRRSKPIVGSDGNDSDIQFSLVEIIRALARSAAREDHRETEKVEAMSLRRRTEDETRSDLRPFFYGTTARTFDRRPGGVAPSGDGFAIQLHGRLALLMDAPNVYPDMRITASGGRVVAEVRYRRSPRLNSLAFSLPMLLSSTKSTMGRPVDSHAKPRM